MRRMRDDREVAQVTTTTETRYASWYKIRVDDHETPEGSYLIGDGRESGWAMYGRYVALRGILMRTPGAVIDLTDQRAANALARRLDMSADELFDMCCSLATMGAITAGDWDRLTVCVPEIWNVQNSYEEKCRKLRENGRKGGRPVEKGSK